MAPPSIEKHITLNHMIFNNINLFPSQELENELLRRDTYATIYRKKTRIRHLRHDLFSTRADAYINIVSQLASGAKSYKEISELSRYESI